MSQRISPFRIMAAGASWRMFGSRRAAETLLQAMSGDDEQSRMLAGMSLVKAGQRSFDLIEEKIEAGEAPAPVIRLLPDIDGKKARAVLDKIAARGTGELKESAEECLDLLDRMDALEPDES
jgi:radical SAM superfamily enzyme with C-terminal helix-hairpin-helix motif